MKGRVTATLLAAFISSGICHAQIFDPAHNVFNNPSTSLDKGHGSDIAGVAIGSDGAPLADVRIEVRNEQNGNLAASGYTNTSGAFEFDNLPTAPYDLVATRGLTEAHQHLAYGDMATGLRVRMNTANGAATQAEGNNTVSVAEYKVPQKARDAYHKAEAALAKRHLDEVTRQLAKSLGICPDYAPALTLRGVLSLDSSNPQAAVEDFDKAVHADPSFAMAYTAMAAAFNQLNKFDDALRSGGRAITLAPRSWQSYFEMAKSYVGKADYEHALQQLAKAQQLVPTEFAPIHLVRAQAMLALKDYGNAINELQAFLTLAPQDPNSGAARQALEKVKAFTAASTNPVVINAAR